MTSSLYRKYNTFSDREQQHRTMTFAELPNHPLLLTMVGYMLVGQFVHLSLNTERAHNAEHRLSPILLELAFYN